MSGRAMRVAVTRDEGPGGPLAAAILHLGMVPVGCAVIREAPPPEPEGLRRAAGDLGRYDWLIAASRRTVVALMAARANEPIPATVRTAAVGRGTAAALEAHGARSPLTAGVAGAAALVVALRGADSWPGRCVLLPRAEEGGRALGEALRGFGAVVEEVVAYRTIARPGDEIASAWSAADPDAVVIASPSAARALVGVVGVARLRRLEAVVAIGPTTARALAALGLEAVVPARAGFDAVAELLRGRPVAPWEACKR